MMQENYLRVDGGRAGADAARRANNGNAEGASRRVRTFTDLCRDQSGSAAAGAMMAATLESTREGIMVVDGNGDIVACNRRFLEMWGIEVQSLAAEDSEQLLLALLGQVRNPVLFFEKITELYWQPEQESYDLVEMSDGRCFERLSRPRFHEGEIAGRLWTFHDITELKKLENELLYAQKMEAMGAFAGGFAHDFNNIMTAVIGYTDLLMAELTPPPPLSGFLENIHGSAHRAIALIKNLLAYSNKGHEFSAKMESNALVQNLSGLLERLVGPDVEFKLRPGETPLGVLVDQTHIEQVLVNLVINARDAMPEGGTVTLALDEVELAADAVKGREYVKPGRYVRIAVSDTGTGMDEATKVRAFDPFFTTKEAGKGTGLGLSTSYGIVKRHGGFISVDSENGKGSTFCIMLPKVELPMQDGHNVPARTPSSVPELVLLVEDDEAVRRLLADVLTGAGYRVVEAADGTQGIAQFRLHRDDIALVILDVIMPGKNGGEVYREIRAIRGDARAIFLSGYTADLVDRQRIRQDGAMLLTKPVRPEKLLRVVREVLDAPREALPEVA